MRSSRPLTPLGRMRKSSRPTAFCVELNTAWSVATRSRRPPASAARSTSPSTARLRMGGDMTYCAASVKSSSHIIDSSRTRPDVTGSPMTRWPRRLAAMTSSAAPSLITCTTYSGAPANCARRSARPVASASSTLGLLSAWPAGPVTPRAIISAWPTATASPFSACTMGSAPLAAHWRRPCTSCSSFTMSAPLYARKNLNELTPSFSASSASSAATVSSQLVTAIWKP
mmetsp:Transcript_13962/g.58301  ORF Transcript_13962/g.58301 Transcript_13962/m.58301 type:complete len:228 (+) Transcript_13962:548-1231(+)